MVYHFNETWSGGLIIDNIGIIEALTSFTKRSTYCTTYTSQMGPCGQHGVKYGVREYKYVDAQNPTLVHYSKASSAAHHAVPYISLSQSSLRSSSALGRMLGSIVRHLRMKADVVNRASSSRILYWRRCSSSEKGCVCGARRRRP